jgi:hypothetical protein
MKLRQSAFKVPSVWVCECVCACVRWWGLYTNKLVVIQVFDPWFMKELKTTKWCLTKTMFRCVSFRFAVLPSSTYLFTAGVKVVYFHLITLRYTPQLVGLLWTRDRPVVETSTWQNKHCTRQTSMPPGGIRTHDPSKRSAVDLRLRTRGHWDRTKENALSTNDYTSNLHRLEVHILENYKTKTKVTQVYWPALCLLSLVRNPHTAHIPYKSWNY